MSNNPDSRRNAQSIGVFIAFVIIVIFFFGLYNSASTIPPASPPVAAAPSDPNGEVQPLPGYTPLVLPPKKDITEKVQTALPEDLSYLVTKAEETEPGRVVVNTIIVDPRGKNGSPQAMDAIRICQTIVPMGYEKISIMEKDRTTYVLYNHPDVPNGVCGEV